MLQRTSSELATWSRAVPDNPATIYYTTILPTPSGIQAKMLNVVLHSSHEPCMLPAFRSPRFGNLMFSLGNVQMISHAFCYFSSRYHGSPQHPSDVFPIL